MANVSIKRGETLTLTCTRTDSVGVPLVLTGTTVTASIKNDSGVKVTANFTVVVLDQGSNPGQFVLTVDASETILWTMKALISDVKYTTGSTVVKTSTFGITVLPAVTD